jgi:C-terminal processing protease CtpA/Prc
MNAVSRAILPLLALAACAAPGASSLRDEAVRAQVGGQMIAALGRQDHYFHDEASRVGFDRRLRRIAQESVDAESYYARVADALAELDEGHTSLVGSREVPFSNTIPPVAIVEAGGVPVVAGVAPGVEGGGLRPGDAILEVDGLPAEKALERRMAVTPGSTPHGRRARAVANLLAGSTHTPVRLSVRGVDGRRRACFPVRFLLDDGGIDRFRFGFLPQSVTAVRVNAATAYVALPDFDPERYEEMEDALRTLAGIPTLVLDLRGNPGGRIRTLQRIAGLFLEQQEELLLLADGSRREPLRAIPGPVRFRGSLRVLVDGRTGSAAELLAAALQDLGRGRVYGSPTAGSTRSRLSMGLPGGVVLHYAGRAEFLRRDGRPLEGLGVQPDVACEPSRDELAREVYGDPFQDPAVRVAAARN